MSVRFWLTRLGYTHTRRSATRWLLALTFAGFLFTMLLLIATGRGGSRWFFVLAVWLALIFAPLWLLIQSLETLGPGIRRRLSAGLAGRHDRYVRRADVAVMVEELFERQVVMPRIATPVEAEKAREAAVALVARTARRPDPDRALSTALNRCLRAVDAWVREAGAWAAAEAPDNIQARWGVARGLAALAAMTRALLAVYHDRAGEAASADGRSLEDLLESTLDFCDDLALEMTVPVWEEPPLGSSVAGGAGMDATEVRAAWEAYAQTPQPAAGALEAFLETAAPS